MKTLRERIDIDAVEYTVTVEAEETPVRGNAMASGDAEADKELEDEILAALERGQVEAWCCLVVTATYTDEQGNEYSGADSLGCCSFQPGRSERRLQDAIGEHVESHGMKETALDALLAAIAKAEADCEPQAQALALHLGCLATECEQSRGGEWTCLTEPGEYRVLTDSEADEEADAYLESYIDEVVGGDSVRAADRGLPHAEYWSFDREGFKRDCLLNDGRGHQLSRYDGDEHEETVGGETYFIYRTN